MKPHIELLLIDFLTSFCFDDQTEEPNIDLLSEIQFQYLNGFKLDWELSLKVEDMISAFKSKHDSLELIENQYLYNVICDFTTEFDLSLIDELTVIQVRKIINDYCTIQLNKRINNYRYENNF